MNDVLSKGYKTIIVFVVTVLMIVVLVSCGKKQGVAVEKTDDTTEVTTNTESTKLETTETTTEDITEVQDNNSQSDNDEEGFKESDYRTDIDYDSINRKPDDYIGLKLKYSGTVVSVIEDDKNKLVQLNLGDDNDFKSLIVLYTDDVIDVRILENDQLTVYGDYYGLFEYEAISGSTKMDPCITAKKITIDNYDSMADAPAEELRVGKYTSVTNSGDFIYNKTIEISYQDGESFGCTMMVVREIQDRGDATIVCNLSGFLIETADNQYTWKVDGEGSVIIEAKGSKISVKATPEPGNEDSFEGLDGEYEYVSE
ncbi:MAG: hypothetical protein J6I58_03975 [Eubacterium sp.]|nr:hypothetical protein [Butyrivibrio sp.]MBP3718664.1 hypothetical protein [Eubacterium sp.]MBR1772432.1 hypothetical protein [Eubacterium sp.]